VNIRAAKVEDAVEIARVVRESYSGLPDALVPADMPNFHPESIVEGLSDSATRWRVLCVSGLPAAVAMWRMIPGMAHLHMLFTDSAHQGRGFGSQLLKLHQDETLEEQPETRLFTLHCLRDSVWALKFYRRHGYTQYQPGDEYRVMDLTIWIDACRKHDSGWPLRENKLLFYKVVR
jgi:GNAT superfamily N-acetyltransferase